MNDSIFSFIKSYIPTDKRNAQEDYLTQMFAWMLNNIHPFADNYISLLCKKGSSINQISVNTIKIATQESIPLDQSGTTGRVDLLLIVNDKIAFVCEHKVWSSLSDNQIDKYMKASNKLGEYDQCYSVLLTVSGGQHTQYADIKIIWNDIYEMIKDNFDVYEERDKVFLENL